MTSKSISPSAFLWEQLQHSLHTWSQSRRCGGPNSSAMPQDHPSTSLASCCTLPTWKRPAGLWAPTQFKPQHQEMLFPSLSVSRKRWGWTDNPNCRVINAISISKESLKANTQSLKNFCRLQAFACPETLAEIREACVFTLCKAQLLFPTMEPSLPGTLSSVLKSIYTKK